MLPVQVRLLGRAARGVPAREVTLPVLEAYQRHVSLRRKPDGMPLAWSTQAKALVPLRVFFSWCAKSRHIALQPGLRAGDAPAEPQAARRPPSPTHEAEAVLSVPDTATAIGLRDRAVMELLYATAMRRGELVGLDLPDVDLTRRLADAARDQDPLGPGGPDGRAGRGVAGALPRRRPAAAARRPGPRARCSWPPTASASGSTWLTGQVHRYIDAADIVSAVTEFPI